MNYKLFDNVLEKLTDALADFYKNSDAGKLVEFGKSYSLHKPFKPILFYRENYKGLENIFNLLSIMIPESSEQIRNDLKIIEFIKDSKEYRIIIEKPNRTFFTHMEMLSVSRIGDDLIKIIFENNKNLLSYLDYRNYEKLDSRKYFQHRGIDLLNPKCFKTPFIILGLPNTDYIVGKNQQIFDIGLKDYPPEYQIEFVGS